MAVRLWSSMPSICHILIAIVIIIIIIIISFIHIR